eukprot:121979-Prymnesium_polylepis.1
MVMCRSGGTGERGSAEKETSCSATDLYTRALRAPAPRHAHLAFEPAASLRLGSARHCGRPTP